MLSEILGELEVEYDADSVTNQIGDYRESGPYHVVREGADFVDLSGYDTHLEKEVVRRVWVQGDRMWIWVEGSGFYEYFERLH